jgi:serine/threonine-protein kinase TTK/MPS1
MRYKTIGRGGSSKVYLVEDPSGRAYALKRVSTSNRSHFDALANEVTLLQQLKHCPHVIQVIDAQVMPDKGVIDIVMERGDIDLKKFLDSERNLTLGDIQIIWRQILEAVHMIHNERIVHSDLKPSNFLLVEGRLKLIDFGIAKRMSNETTHISRDKSVGTISYMAPEAVKQGTLKLGRSSDIWSLGIILYQIVYQQPPFAHLDPMQRVVMLQNPNMTMNFPAEHRLQGHSEDTKAPLMDVLERCLQRDPRRRPTIPELLQHPFLQNSLQDITRCAFDQTMQALMPSFREATRSIMNSQSQHSPSELDGKDVEPEQQWQLLADQVWERMSHHSGSLLRRRKHEESSSADMLGFTPYSNVLRHWIGTGDCKRQRMAHTSEEVGATPLADRALAEPSAVPSRATGGKAAGGKGQRGKGPPPPPPPRSKAPPAKPSAVARSLPSSAVAAAQAAHKKDDSSDQMVIDSDTLQQHRAGLKKVGSSVARDKENMSTNTTAKDNGKMSHDNKLLRRLAERRRIVADDPTGELTHTGFLPTMQDR